MPDIPDLHETEWRLSISYNPMDYQSTLEGVGTAFDVDTDESGNDSDDEGEDADAPIQR